MKKRYSEYIGYSYTGAEEWFNPQVEWDTLLFIDPMLLKNTSIDEFKHSYKKLVEFFSKAMVKLESNIPESLKNSMVQFDEVREANLGFSYDSNIGSGLTGKTSISVLNNINRFIKKGLFGVENFLEISLFDKNVSGDRITDMIINITKNDFIHYSCRIAKENSFPTKKFKLKQEYNFEEMRWNYGLIDIPYIINENGKEIPVLLIPKEFLVTTLYFDEDNFMSWIYHNDMNYVKNVFDYNLKSDIDKNKKKIMEDIIENNRAEILNKFLDDGKVYAAYDLSEDKENVNNIYELAYQFYNDNKDYLLNKKDDNSVMPVKMVVEILIQYLQMVVKDKKGYVFLMTNGNKFISEPKISKFVHILFESRIKDAGFNVDISPETNAGNGPVDFKISRGDDKILIENKISSNIKLLECIDENKQIHTYLKQEECKDAYLVVFINKESDVDKINLLIKKASEYKDKYNIYIKDVDCIKRESASHR